MTSHGASASRVGVDVAAAAAVVAAAAGGGALYAASAFFLHPLALPAVLLLAGLAVVTLSRPEVGIAFAFLLVPLGNLGLTGDPPWILLAGWSSFLLAVALIGGRLAGALDRRTVAMAIVAVAYLLVTLVGAVTLTDTLSNAFAVLRSIATGLLLAAAVVAVVRRRDQLIWVLGGVAVSLAIAGGHSVWQFLAGAETSSAFVTTAGSLVSRIDAGFGQPNQLAGYLIVLIPFAVAGAMLGRRSRLLFAAAVALGVAAVYLSFSRGALIGLVVIPIVFLRRRRLLLAVAIVVAVLAATPSLLSERFSTLTEGGPEVASRVDIWEAAVTLWTEQPLLGVGPGAFPEAYARTPGTGFLPGTLFEPPPHAHNLPLNVLAEGGIVGFALLAAVLVLAALACVRARSSPARWISVAGSAGLAALAAFVVHNQFDVTLVEGTGTYFWALLGLMAAIGRAADVPTEVPVAADDARSP